MSWTSWCMRRTVLALSFATVFRISSREGLVLGAELLVCGQQGLAHCTQAVGFVRERRGGDGRVVEGRHRGLFVDDALTGPGQAAARRPCDAPPRSTRP